MAIDNAKILNVRIKNKYDSYEKWIDSDLILEAGEIAIAHTTIDDVTVDNGTVKHPGLLMKVGDGEHTFSALPWLSAKAADVLSVCKNETSLKDFIKTVISANDGALKNLETALKALIKAEETRALAAEAKLAQDILAVDGKVNELARIEAEGKAALTKALNEETTARKEDKQELVKALEETRNTMASNKAELAQDIADAQAAAEDYADGLNAAMDERMVDVESLLGLGGEATGKTVAEQIAEAVKTEEDARKEAVQAVQDEVDALEQTHAIDKKTLEDAIALKADITALNAVSDVANAAVKQADYDVKVAALEAEDARIEGLVTTEAAKAREEEGKLAAAIKAIADDYLTEADKTELQGNIDTLTGVVETLSDGIDANKVDGVKDLIAYVETHGPEVTGMKEDIADNAAAIAAIYAVDGETKSGVLVDEIARIEGLVSAEASRAEGEEAKLAGKIDVLEKANAAGGAVANAIEEAKQAGLDAAKEVADDLAEEVTAREAAIAQEVTDRNTAITNAIAKEVTDRNNAIDTAIATEVTNRDAAIATAKGEAATDATNKANAAQAAAEATAAADATAKANAAQAAAEATAATDATNKANQALADAKTHVAEEIAKLDGSVAVSSTKHVLTGVTEVDGKLTDKTEVELANIAFSGLTDDLVQGTMTLVFDCGTSANV